MTTLMRGNAMYETPGPTLEELVNEHASLVKRIAHHLKGRLPDSVLVDDLIQSGMIGLFEAARNYDRSKGAAFETYAGIRIRGAMLDEVRKGDWVPRSVHRNGRKISSAIHSVESREGRDANDQEVADELGISLDGYFDLLKDSQGSRLYSFEEMLSSGENDGSSEVEASGPQGASPDERVEKVKLQQSIVEAIKSLPEREQLVLSLYYDEELNLKEIGEVLGVSESRVSQIHSQAAGRLRVRLGNWQEDD